MRTGGPGLRDVTRDVAEWVAAQGMAEGLLTLLCRHTSASLTIQENADPDVQVDLQSGMDRLAPRDFGWVHDCEGPDDMPAHLRTVLSGVHLSVPLIGGRLALGTWQGIYLWEHRDRPHRREIALHLVGS
ncbi:secondary thiamine-phosphate synthase enzyme YjbQ [Rhodovulum sp. DZ06]|uniref:secondary thiamine-phosphate synthase enzyme YjbQ n=1 Tax=Rhodovulum sp. DZ06 TaxID=3425126 RepID=UPI003D33CC9D